jgi:hypothetical protein
MSFLQLYAKNYVTFFSLWRKTVLTQENLSILREGPCFCFSYYERHTISNLQIFPFMEWRRNRNLFFPYTLLGIKTCIYIAINALIINPHTHTHAMDAIFFVSLAPVQCTTAKNCLGIPANCDRHEVTFLECSSCWQL